MFRVEEDVENIRKIQHSNSVGRRSLLIIGRGNRQGFRNIQPNSHISYMTPDPNNFDYTQMSDDVSIFCSTLREFYERCIERAHMQSMRKFPLFDTIVIDGGTLHHLVEPSYNSLVELLNVFLFFAKPGLLVLVYHSPPWELATAEFIQRTGQRIFAPIHWYLDKLLEAKGFWRPENGKRAFPNFGPRTRMLFDGSGNQTEEGSGALAFEEPYCVMTNIPTKNEILQSSTFREIELTRRIQMQIPMD